MKISERAKLCELSPMRKFHPYAAAAEARGRKIYHLNIGQPDIATPPAFFDALKQFRQPVLEYDISGGNPALVHAIQDYYARIGVNYDTNDIYITMGGSEALNIVMMCILDPGDEVLVAEPFYPNYATFIRAAGGSIRPIPTSPEEGYRFADRAKIEAQITKKTRAILITDPSNPTGVVLTKEDQRLILDIAKEHNLYVISDEVYREFVYNNEPLGSIAQFDDAAEHIVLIDSVSKRFSACGARIGCLISKNECFMSQAMKFCQARLAVSTLDQIASAALYQVDQDYFEATRQEYKHRRDTIMAKLRQIPGVVCTEPQGAFYLMAALPVDDAEAFQLWLLNEFEDNGETVMFSPGHSFYATPGKGINEIRIAYILKETDLSRAMDLLALGIQAYNQQAKEVPHEKN